MSKTLFTQMQFDLNGLMNAARLGQVDFTEEELRYILDPKHVYGEDFPSETFRVLKEKETRLYNEYRTKRLLLEAWKRLHLANAGLPSNNVYKVHQP